MATSAVIRLLLCVISSAAGYRATLLPACRHCASAVTFGGNFPRRVAPVIAADMEEPADEAAAYAQGGESADFEANAAAAEGTASNVDNVSEEQNQVEEEEEEDLLSTPAFLKQKLKVLEKELADVETKAAEVRQEAAGIAEEWQDKRARLQGDFDNFKARHLNQTLEAQLDARIKVLDEFLPVLDNFDRARASISPEGEVQDATNARYTTLHAGLMSALAEMGMEKMEVVGQEFDYNLHNAIQQVPSDEYDEGIVCSELQPGYLCKDKLVRVAYVMVSSG